MKRFIFIILASFSLLCACEKEIRFNGDYDGEKLVLYSVANPDSILTAKVFKSTFILSVESPYRLNQISGAHVWAEVNGQDIYEFRERTTEYRYDYGDEWSVQIVIDYISEYQPKPGDHIVVKASHSKYTEVYGETTVPQRPSISVSPMEFKTDRRETEGIIRACVNVTIDDPADKDNYYRMNMAKKNYPSEYEDMPDDFEIPEWSWRRVYSDDVIFFKTGLGDLIDSIEDTENVVPEYFDDGAFRGEAHCFSIWAMVTTGEQNSPVASDFKIAVENMSESLYRYCKSSDAAFGANDLGSIFGEPVSIYNNIVNGIGCVGAVASTEIWLK